MTYAIVPPNLHDMFKTINSRLVKLETTGPGLGIEPVTDIGSAFGGTTNVDLLTAPIVFYTSSATANGTLNFRGSSNVPLDNIIQPNQAITCAVIVTNGLTAYYPTAFTIDGSTPYKTVWANGTAPASGTANGEDVYSFTFTKLTSDPHWHMRAQVVSYA
jgi:hypothetical protein